jgi:hypothetical protein
MTTEARMNEPSRIRGRWTINICRRCGQHYDPEQYDEVCSCLHETGARTLVEVEVVPVPDEQGIERAAKALRRLIPFDQDHAELVRAVLAAALEQPE